MTVVKFPGSRASPPARKASLVPAYGIPLTKIAEAAQAIRFLEEDTEAAEALLEVFAQGIREGRRDATVASPLALKYRRYFDYTEEGWEAAHSRMFDWCIGL
jgi:hypothetical protein